MDVAESDFLLPVVMEMRHLCVGAEDVQPGRHSDGESPLPGVGGWSADDRVCGEAMFAGCNGQGLAEGQQRGHDSDHVEGYERQDPAAHHHHHRPHGRRPLALPARVPGPGPVHPGLWYCVQESHGTGQQQETGGG